MHEAARNLLIIAEPDTELLPAYVGMERQTKGHGR